MRHLLWRAGLTLGSALLSTSVFAADLTIASGAVATDIEVLRQQLDLFEKETGHKVQIAKLPPSTTDQFALYKTWLSAESEDVDVYRIDVIWPPQIANHLIDLTEATKDVVGEHFPSIIEAHTVDGKLVALPFFTDAPMLYYRKDLLEKHGASVPKTWAELTSTAKMIQEKERAQGNDKLWGFVWQGNSYEGLTCNALEWVKSAGGGQIIEPDGTISINNPEAAAAIDLAATWVSEISPPGVTGYMEEDARGVWQTGNAVFMRNWPYAYAGSNSADSSVKGRFDVTTLPLGGDGNESAATLGGWSLSVAKYSKNQEAAIELVKFLASKDMQKMNALQSTRLPTVMALYDDPEVLEVAPFFPNMLQVLSATVPRPSAPTKKRYNEVSKEFWTAVHNTLSGEGDAATNLASLEKRLKRIKGRRWK